MTYTIEKAMQTANKVYSFQLPHIEVEFEITLFRGRYRLAKYEKGQIVEEVMDSHHLPSVRTRAKKLFNELVPANEEALKAKQPPEETDD